MRFLGKKNLVIFFMLTTLIMFVVVMFIVNPYIDKSNGLSVITLQLAFDKQAGIDIVSHWNIEAFKRWIWTDYVYALSYTLFFISLLSWLLNTKVKEDFNWQRLVIYLPLVAGLFDWIENSLELWFLYDTAHFSQTVFFLHSCIAMIKWSTLPLVAIFIILLFKQDRQA